ncbi:hypothetical protein PTTG_10838 [Puccinia triticina 1-1 BBBD Race 1]|uniref:Uncharacterized protein n=2 Tax=Puccinia triticina TaxID=208348 RepID=A0A0C4FC86_PUCT1|nr:uncharacterized protein PtA15_6A50 [Puccinia triticina]OAV87780.1 hypothetical protein PTTG_10838 [Puccinia triticina 1-1 BBBD Race 1]WAQ85422.1 hypothetical protein PtA15_6A50 [Puccinia triticina]WAR55308.1 hypothetical protein PtB15_6B47 [Puccinia triticina]
MANEPAQSDGLSFLSESSNAPSSTPDEEKPSEDDEACSSSHSSSARYSENHDSDESAIDTPTNNSPDAPIQATTKKAVEPPIQAPSTEDLVETGLIFEGSSIPPTTRSRYCKLGSPDSLDRSLDRVIGWSAELMGFKLSSPDSLDRSLDRVIGWSAELMGILRARRRTGETTCFP